MEDRSVEGRTKTNFNTRRNLNSRREIRCANIRREEGRTLRRRRSRDIEA